ncbi:hypothetical protein AB894_00825 [Piscirickettsia salmonis]|nr:hypothetical protein AB894_00825 [Piscirickettsia salmonis]
MALKTYEQLINYAPYLIAALILYLMATSPLFAAGEDYLSGIKDATASSFGEGSTFEHLLYLGEGIAGVYAYIKTKNIMVLAGLVVVMIFTHFGFAIAMA